MACAEEIMEIFSRLINPRTCKSGLEPGIKNDVDVPHVTLGHVHVKFLQTPCNNVAAWQTMT